MTVTYSLNVANAKLTGFSKLLLRWKGSIYKLLYREMLIFCVLYYILSMSYRYVLDDQQKIVFEKCVIYCRAFTNLIPLSFVLGFYVSIVVSRWWQQFMQIPWPDKAVLLISGYVRGDDERGRIIRRTLARYLVLMQVLTFQAVSTSVRRRFPTLDHIQEVGLFTPEERFAYDEIIGTHGKWWVPAQWFTSLVTRARRAGRIKHDYLMDKIIEELHAYRSNCGMMFAYDWISIPLVYTQTVTIATYTYFIATIMGRQYLDPKDGQVQSQSHIVDLYFPIFTILEFFFFMGWLKVAEQLINPYGEDDDDFELNWCLDRNLLISYIIVDEMYNKHPKLVPDMYWDKREPILPYTKSSINMKLQAQPHLGSTVNLAVEPEDFLPMETIMEEEREDFNYSSPPGTSTIDYNNSMPSLFRNPNSTFVQMENQQSNLSSNLFNKNNYNNISKNHSELIEELKAESNSSRANSRNSTRFLPYFLKDSKLIHKLFYSSNNSISIPNSNNNLPNINNYSQGNFPIHQNKKQSNETTFLLKTPSKKNRKPSNEDPVNKSLYQNQPLLANNASFSMNTSTNASNSNLNSLNNNFNNSLSSSKINTSNSNLNDILSNTNLNVPLNFSMNNNISANSNHVLNQIKTKQTLNKKFSSKESDDLTSNPTNQLSIKNKNYKNLKISKTNMNSPRKYCNLPTAPVLSSTSNNNKFNKMSPFMNNLRNSFNFSSHQYRNLNKLSSRKKQNSFSSALSLKLNNDNTSNDQLVSSNGFHFPKSYEPKTNLNHYLPPNFKNNLDNSKNSIKNEDNFKIKTNEEECLEDKNLIEIKISPASNCSYKDLNSSQSLLENYEENLIVMDDLKKIEDKEEDENTKFLDISKPISRNDSTFSINKAASILKSTVDLKNKNFQNETNNESLTNLVSLNIKFSENTSNKSLSLDLNSEENKSTKNDQLETLSNQSLLLDSQKHYSPNEDCAEEHYEESPTSSNSSISPYESNQSTVTSYTQLLEKDKEYFN